MADSQLAPVLFTRATGYRLRGRIHFDKACVGEVVPGRDESYVVFRKMILDPLPGRTEPGALFTVRFHFNRLSTEANKRLSLLPAPFIAAQPGFRSKSWMLGEETGMFQGVYEWQTVADAEAYWASFPMRLMKRRAAPATLWREIIAT